MTLILDTHSAIWAATNQSHLLTPSALAAVSDRTSRRLLSIASCWEIAIKAGLDKLELEVPLSNLFSAFLIDLKLEVLPIRVTHTLRIAALPHHHRDPFDRMLVAQALVEDIPIVSKDPKLDAYGIRRIW